MMRPFLLAAVALLAACSKAPESQPPAAPPAATAAAHEIAWIRPQTVADVDRAFADAKAKNQPVFLFWTAVWCPPCNQVKSTIFTRPEFIERSRSFVPVYVDADSPSGQALGQRFRVRGYPTMVLLEAGGQEVTRLAGSVDAAKYMQLLDRGLAGGNSAKQSLDAALAGRALPTDDWRMLAFYSWGTDDGQLVPEADVPATLLKLAAACPPEQREASSRLVLQALFTASQAKEGRPKIDAADAIASVTSLLGRPELARENHDILGYGANDIVGLLTAPKSKQRDELVARWTAVLDRLAADSSLSNEGRMYAMLGKVELARLENKNGPLPATLLDEVRSQAGRVDREVKDLDERQAVITTTGAVLARAGLFDESDALLKAELPRSHSPYYYMSQLAWNAKERGTPEGKAAAVDWSRQAWDSARGSATRLRWGGGYLNTLLELAPQNVPAIEQTAARIIGEVKSEGMALAGNNRRDLERMSRRLSAWNKNGSHDDVLARLNASMKDTCAAHGETDHSWCDSLFMPARRA
ncbi:MAG: thioredoxin family protein [Burkholderiaceae bacterium]|jgi:thioredoxin-related protein|nr:thioredoxin family protein [Burkholderiaceae bacterium]